MGILEVIYGSSSIDYSLFNDVFNIDVGMNNKLESNRKEVIVA
jgi:hypothetical protein